MRKACHLIPWLGIALLLLSIQLVANAACSVSNENQSDVHDASINPALVPNIGDCILGDSENNANLPIFTEISCADGGTYYIKTWRDNLADIHHDIACTQFDCTQCISGSSGQCQTPPIKWGDRAWHQKYDGFDDLVYDHIWLTGYDTSTLCGCGKHGCLSQP